MQPRRSAAAEAQTGTAAGIPALTVQCPHGLQATILTCIRCSCRLISKHHCIYKLPEPAPTAGFGFETSLLIKTYPNERHLPSLSGPLLACYRTRKCESGLMKILD